jgi:hypothetical protein
MQLLLASTAVAQATFPIGFSVDTYALERVPTELKFQARISQARMPVGDGRFQKLTVSLMRDGTAEVCSQTFSNVSVKDSVLNLDINNLACKGRNQQTIAVDEAIAQYANLQLQVCVGEGSCLASVPLGSVPYAMKSSFAVEAHEARMAEVSAQAHYAHRVTADLDMLTSGQLGTGYFDFVTPDLGYVPGPLDIYTDYSPHFDEGFVTWAPVSAAPDARRLNLCAKDDLGNLVDLDGFVVHAATTTLGGSLVVESESTLHGAVVANAGVSVSAGNVTVDTGNISVPAGLVSVGPASEVLIHQAGIDAPSGQVNADTVEATNILHAPKHLYVGTAPANPSETPDMHVDAPASFTGNLSVGSQEAPGQLSVEGDLLVGSGAVGANPAAEELVVAASSSFAGPASFTNEGNGVSFEGPASFNDTVSFTDDTATVTFHGPVSFEKAISLPAGVGVANDSVTNAAIVDEAVDSRTIADGTVLPEDLHPSVRGLFQTLVWQSWVGTRFVGTGGASAVAYGNGRWVAVGGGRIHTSIDGNTWEVAFEEPYVDFNDVTYSPTAGWMAVGFDAEGVYSVAMTSSNGTSWGYGGMKGTGFEAVHHDGVGRWVVVGTGDLMYTSVDGNTWSQVDLSNLHIRYLQDIVYGNGRWVAVGNKTDYSPAIVASLDGITWSSQLDAGYSDRLVSVAYDGTGQFVAVGTAGIFKSSNGTSWTRVMAPVGIRHVTHGNGFWVATSTSAYNPDLVSADAIQWQTVEIPPSLLAADDAGNWIGISGETIYRRTSIPGL